MGQQQLLLLVLGIVIVGIAIIVGISAYGEGNTRVNWDALLQDALRMAGDAQSWKGTPELFGGSPDATKPDENDFSEVDFHFMGYGGVRITDQGLCYKNLNGVFGLDPTNNRLEIEAANQSHGNSLIIRVTGTSESHIELDELKITRGFVISSEHRNVNSIKKPRGCT